MKKVIDRQLKSQLMQKFFSGKALVVVGARQVGKTTLSNMVVRDFGVDAKAVKVFNCDNPTDRELLDNRDLTFLKSLIGGSKIVFIDEAQKVASIGQTVKLLVDHYKEEKQILLTGSSTINLLDSVHEPLTGRKFVFTLFPLSVQEIYQDDYLLLLKNLEQHLIFGNYPEVVFAKNFETKMNLLDEITDSYLFKDILEFQQVKNSSVLRGLLKALALQIGSEVSQLELATMLGVDKNTINRYMDLLEKNFIIFQLSPYFKNKRKEISKHKKVFFYDLGIRNSLIKNFNFLDSRNDIGALWENFVVCERLKFRAYHGIRADQYFWRSYSGAEIDLVEDRGGQLHGYEIKWNEKTNPRPPKTWGEIDNTYYSVINRKKLLDFIL